MTTLPVTYGYARVSKSDDAGNVETQLQLLANHCIRENLVSSDIATGRTLRHTGWQELMSRLRTGHTLAVAFLDRLSRNFEDGVRIQAGPGAYQLDSTSERIKLGLDQARVMQCSPATVKKALAAA